MINTKIVFFFLLLFFVFFAKGQNFTISGTVKDENSGEDLIGASVQVVNLKNKGGVTNTYGFYSISLPKGKYELSVRFLGYVPQTIQVDLQASKKLNFKLVSNSNMLSEVVIEGERKDENVRSVQMGVQKLSTNELQNIPVLFGERDVIKNMQLLPGISAGGEGSSGFSVRGGALDQNLILLDEATVYNASHLLGFFSVFNSDAIKDLAIYKGNGPAEYGGRLSSILDVKMQDGNEKKFGVKGGIGLISSRLTIDGPLVKNRGSFILSGRRTYADLFLKLSNNPDLRKASLYFYDLNLKANYLINDKNRIYLSGYFGRDVLGFASDFNINWGNATGTIRWNHLFSSKLFSNTSLILGDYDYTIKIGLENDIRIQSKIMDYSLKQDFQYYINTSHLLKFGLIATYRNILPGEIKSSMFVIENTEMNHSLENAVYVSHRWNISEQFIVEYGSRLGSFSLLGPGTFNTYDQRGNLIKEEEFASGEAVKTYINVEPRASFNFVIDDENSIKTAYARNVQNIHLLSNSTSGNPTDLWIPSSNNIKPQLADQFSLGYYRNFLSNLFETSAEIYYKHMQNQIDYRDGAELNFNRTVESQILSGMGRAYGLEIFLKKCYGQFNGWISYTLSRTERRFEGINNGKFFPARQDRTHDISIVGIYELSKKWTLSATWVYSTGNAVTFPVGKYEVDGKVLFYYTQRNADRMPDYHRLDLGATWTVKKTARYESSWAFSIYNAYGRENPFSIFFRENEDDPTKTEAVQITLFRFVPSVSYNFKF